MKLFIEILLILSYLFLYVYIALALEDAAGSILEYLEVLELGVSDHVFETLTAVRTLYG